MTKAILGWNDLTPALHGEVCKWIQTIPPRRKCTLMPRDHFKTTIAMSLGIHIVIQGKEANLYFPGQDGSNVRILYSGENASIAEDRLGWIKRQFVTNSLLRALWPHKVWDDPRAAGAEWNNTSFVLPRTKDYPESTFERIGVDGAVTGHHFDVIIKDDLISLAAANSSTLMGSTIRWNEASFSLFNDPKTGLEFMFGTRWAAWDLYTSIESENPKSPIPTVFNEKWRAVIEDGKILFPERFTYEDIADLQLKKKDLFYLNYMNTTAGSSLNDFQVDRVRGFELIEDSVFFSELPSDDALHQVYDPQGHTKPEPQKPREATDVFDEPLDKQRLTPEYYRALRGRGGSGLLLKFS